MPLWLTSVETLATMCGWGVPSIPRICANFGNVSPAPKLVSNTSCRVAGQMGSCVRSVWGSRLGLTRSGMCSSVGRVGARRRRRPGRSCTVLTCPSRSGSGPRTLWQPIRQESVPCSSLGNLGSQAPPRPGICSIGCVEAWSTRTAAVSPA